MSKHIENIVARGNARIVEAPITSSAPHQQVDVDRNFELPKALYMTTAGLYLAFCAVMWMGLSTPGLVIPMVIFGPFIIAGFGVPAIWARLGDNSTEPMNMGVFARKGIMTATGRLAARDAAIQMLILPTLIVMWGITIIVIAAIVS